MLVVTTTPRKSFETRRRNLTKAPIPFDINGEEFKCHPERIPASVMMDIPGMAVSMDSAPMWEFFEAALGEDYDRFRKLVRSPDVAIEADELVAIVAWLAEESTERPTAPPSP